MPERLTIWHETKGDSKIPIFQLFSELGEIWKYKLLKLINTNLSFPSVSWEEKLWSPITATFKNASQKEKVQSRAKNQHSKIPI